MWLVKKYFFTNQLKNNLTQSSLVPITDPAISPLHENTYNYTLLLSLYNQSPQNQLNYLTFSTRHLTTESAADAVSSTYDFYISTGDLDLLRSNNLSFLNKLTYSTSNEGLKYYTTLGLPSITNEVQQTLMFRR